MTELDWLPGASLVTAGLAQLARGEASVEALVVSVATERLRALGLEVGPPISAEPELELYAQLGRVSPGDAFTRYDALLSELDSFLEALTARRRRVALRSG